MLNIFHVNQGENLVIEVDNVFGELGKIKQKIQGLTNIPSDQFVLLLRDGTMIMSQSDVFSQNAGIESNPIFLYTKSYTDVLLQNTPKHYEISDEIEYALKLPYCYETVEIRTKLVRKITDLAQEIFDFNSEAYHSQIMQHTGWTAIVRNLEVLVNAVKVNYDSFLEDLVAAYENREQNVRLLESSDELFDTLENIPLPMFMEQPELQTDDSPSVNLCEHLFGDYWIGRIIVDSERGLSIVEKITPDRINAFKESFMKIKEEEGDQECRLIHGMQDRLRDLDGLNKESKALCQTMGDFCQIFEADFERVRKTNDVSVFPDLCRSHEAHLTHVAKDYSKLRSYRKRIHKSKYELITNINRRLGWVNRLHTNLRDFHNNIVVYSGMLVILKDVLSRLHIVSNTPHLFYKAVSEILRRKVYAENYRKWAYKLFEDCNSIFTNETSLRDNFAVDFYKNVLSSKIDGLCEKPSSFGCIPGPEEFDINLPTIGEEDIKMILESCPEELKPLFTIEENYGIPQFVMAGLKDDGSKETTTTPIEDGSEDFASAIGSLEPYDTEPEDFEEIPQSMEETVKYVTDCHEQQLSGIEADDPYAELIERKDQDQQTEDILKYSEIILEIKQTEERCKEEVQSMKDKIDIEHKKELKEMECFTEEKYEKLIAKYEEEKKKMKKEHDAALENCRQQHKLEMEGLRSRYRMMTTANMDKSPSETSLEKIDNVQEYITSIRANIKEEFDIKLETALRSEQEKNMEQIMKIRVEKDEECSNALKASHRRFYKVIDDLRARSKNMKKEIEKERKNQKCDELRGQITALKDLTLTQLRQLNCMTTQIKLYKMKEESTNPEEREQCMKRLGNVDSGFPSYMLYSCFPHISTETADVHQLVIFAWDKRYNHYRAVVDDAIGLFFLHQTCHASLGIIKDCPNKHPCIGKIYNREKCKLKKEENRFGLPKDSFFCRLRACHPKAEPPANFLKKYEAARDRKVSRQPVFAEIPELDSSSTGSLPGSESGVLKKTDFSREDLFLSSQQFTEPDVDSVDSPTVKDADSDTDFDNLVDGSDKSDAISNYDNLVADRFCHDVDSASGPQLENPRYISDVSECTNISE